MLYQQGQYEQGIIFAQQTCDLAKSYSLTNEPIYAYSLNLLAILYQLMGQYEQALPLHQQALEILGKSLGTDHPDYAGSLNNLAALYKSMGQYERFFVTWYGSIGGHKLTKSLSGKRLN